MAKAPVQTPDPDLAASQDEVVNEAPPKFAKMQAGEVSGVVGDALEAYKAAGEVVRRDGEGRHWRFFFNSEDDMSRYSIRVTFGRWLLASVDLPWSSLAGDDGEERLTGIVASLANEKRDPILTGG